MRNEVLRKTTENVRKHRGNKLVTTEAKRIYLMSEPNYHKTKFLSESLLAIEIKKIQIFISKPVYLGLTILEINKMVMYEFWYDSIKPKYG